MVEEISKKQLHEYAEYYYDKKYVPLINKAYKLIKEKIKDNTFDEYIVGDWILTRSKFKPCYVINKVNKYKYEDNFSECIDLKEAINILFDFASYPDEY